MTSGTRSRTVKDLRQGLFQLRSGGGVQAAFQRHGQGGILLFGVWGSSYQEASFIYFQF